MLRTSRIAVGILMMGLLLAGTQFAVRDCKAELFRLDNCIWLRASEYLGVPWQSKGLRAAFFATVGAALLAGIYLAYRYILSPGLRPPRRGALSGTGLAADTSSEEHTP